MLLVLYNAGVAAATALVAIQTLCFGGWPDMLYVATWKRASSFRLSSLQRVRLLSMLCFCRSVWQRL